jgi:hypothetical protein
MQMIRKGQIRWLAKGHVVGQIGSSTRFTASLHDMQTRKLSNLPRRGLFATHRDKRLTESEVICRAEIR